MMRRRGQSESQSVNERLPPSSFTAVPQVYPHTTTYRSLQAVLRLHSPSLKAQGGAGRQQLEPVFGDGDIVNGTVTLDRSCSSSGRLTVTLEGALTCFPASEGNSGPNFDIRKHIFFTTSHAINVATAPTSDLSSARSAFRGMAKTIRRRPSAASLEVLSPTTSMTPEKERSFPFSFTLPRSLRSGEELPPTYPLSKDVPSPSSPSSSPRVGSFTVAYKVLVSWDPVAAYENPSFLEAPFLYQPDHDFHSLDEKAPGSWLEMPLRTDRPIPFRCAITLPTSVTFPRSSSIPYFVVFTTTTRSPTLVKEIASDATISVSLLRQVTVTESVVFPPTPPLTPNSSEDDIGTRQKIMRLMTPSRTSRSIDDSFDVRNKKPLPRLPAQTVFSETYSLRTSICIGFPKRPRRHGGNADRHPSLEEHVALPDGLHKAKFLLDKDMLPSIDWAGISVKYYLDASVLVGQDEVRARVPIRII